MTASLVFLCACVGQKDVDSGPGDTDVDTDTDTDTDTDVDTGGRATVVVVNDWTRTIFGFQYCYSSTDCTYDVATIEGILPGESSDYTVKAGEIRLAVVDEDNRCDVTDWFVLERAEVYTWNVVAMPGTWSDGCVVE